VKLLLALLKVPKLILLIVKSDALETVKGLLVYRVKLYALLKFGFLASVYIFIGCPLLLRPFPVIVMGSELLRKTISSQVVLPRSKLLTLDDISQLLGTLGTAGRDGTVTTGIPNPLAFMPVCWKEKS
jgi:hypothetical protein